VKLAIGIPTLNRFDMLHPFLIMYLIDFPDTKIYVVDNGHQGIKSKISNPNIIIHESESNLGVASSWNLLCDNIFKEHDYALILNDDIYLGYKLPYISELLSRYKRNFYKSTYDFSTFILPKITYNMVGRFDNEFYPAYYEDNDYQYRMRLLNLSVLETPMLNAISYQSSKTLEKEPSLKKLIFKNKERYIEKWGGLPKKEVFTKPFNK